MYIYYMIPTWLAEILELWERDSALKALPWHLNLLRGYKIQSPHHLLQQGRSCPPRGHVSSAICRHNVTHHFLCSNLHPTSLKGSPRARTLILIQRVSGDHLLSAWHTVILGLPELEEKQRPLTTALTRRSVSQSDKLEKICSANPNWQEKYPRREGGH